MLNVWAQSNGFGTGTNTHTDTHTHTNTQTHTHTHTYTHTHTHTHTYTLSTCLFLTLSREIVNILDVGVNFEQNCRNGLWTYNMRKYKIIKRFVREGSTWKMGVCMLIIFLEKGWCKLQFSSFKISIFKVDSNATNILHNSMWKENSIV